MKKIITLGVFSLGFIGATLFISSESALASSWYKPVWYNSNIECQTGYAYGPNNLKNGKCRVRWDGVVNDTIGNVTGSAINGFYGNRN